MKITAEPRSDQFNADDLVGGPRTFTIAAVHPGKAEQKYDIELQGEERVWRPPLTVLRLMLEAWGDEAKDWAGQSVTLFRDPSITFGRDQVGGIRVSHMTGLPDGKPLKSSLTVKRGKRGVFTVQPLTEPPPPPPSATTAADVEAATTVGELRALWQGAPPDVQPLITAKVEQIKAAEPAETLPEDQP